MRKNKKSRSKTLFIIILIVIGLGIIFFPKSPLRADEERIFLNAQDHYLKNQFSAAIDEFLKINNNQFLKKWSLPYIIRSQIALSSVDQKHISLLQKYSHDNSALKNEYEVLRFITGNYLPEELITQGPDFNRLRQSLRYNNRKDLLSEVDLAEALWLKRNSSDDLSIEKSLSLTPLGNLSYAAPLFIDLIPPNLNFEQYVLQTRFFESQRYYDQCLESSRNGLDKFSSLPNRNPSLAENQKELLFLRSQCLRGKGRGEEADDLLTEIISDQESVSIWIQKSLVEVARRGGYVNDSEKSHNALDVFKG